jgi:plasmid stability protein
MQYTIRNVPPDLDRALRARARKLGKSVNQVAVDALAQSVGQVVRYRNLRQMPGAWSEKEAAAFDRLLQEERARVDEELWK